ncbi:MAG TPA: FHA domain-containing protein [Streptosporangiaceae bacterium]|nr:FHA domain-containing protein [Streptosporangiaceae bacterium]
MAPQAGPGRRRCHCHGINWDAQSLAGSIVRSWTWLWCWSARRRELAEKYALLAADQPRAAQALARQFAVGVLIIERGDTALREKVFIAPYTRMIAGRSDDNEIVLPSALASGHHFAISADGANAYVEDLGSFDPELPICIWPWFRPVNVVAER